MRTTTWTTMALIGMLAAGCAAERASARTPAMAQAPTTAQAAGLWPPDEAGLVDLTHAFDDKTIYWPTATSGFVLESVHHGKTPSGFFYSANKMCAPEHGGTHLDAPIHFAEGRSTADAVPLSRLVGPAVVIDVSAAAAKDADYRLTRADIKSFEQQHGAIAPGTIVMIRSGWGKRWPDRRQYLGDDRPGDASNLHFPGIGEDAARLLVARQIAAVGIDTASIDHGPSKDFIAHQVLLGADIPAFENVASLEALPARGAVVIALPMKIKGGSGGPLRVVAVLPP
jgi:kynurenine formamidase